MPENKKVVFEPIGLSSQAPVWERRHYKSSPALRSSITNQNRISHPGPQASMISEMRKRHEQGRKIQEKQSL